MNNNAISTIVNAAYAQATGSAAVDTLDLYEIIDKGTASNLFTTSREQFTKALIEQCAKFIFTDESYQKQYNDPYFVDSRRFASVTQLISVEAPAVKENPAWKAYTSGSSTIGTYTVYLPVIESKLYAKTASYSLDIAITNEQWDDAVRSADELARLVDYIFLAVENALIQHREDMNAANRNNFIAEKIAAEADANVDGVHVVNLLTLYNSERGKSIATVAAFRSDPDAMRFAAKTIMLYTEYLQKQTAIFNTEGKVKFVPRDRIVLEVNSAFETGLEEVALSSTYHDAMVSLPSYHSVPYWQSPTGASSLLDFDTVTTIDVALDSNTDITQSGVVALLADKYCIMHTIRSERVASQYFDIDAMTLYSYQNRDAYMNNLGLPAVVFILEAPSQGNG